MKKIYVVTLIILVVSLAAGCATTSPQPAQPQPGVPAADFQLPALVGAPVTLSALKGQPVLLNFWATWCGPCRAEMPYIQEIYQDQKWQARGLVILAVNLQEPAATVRNFMADNGYSFTVLLDSGGQTGQLYNVRGIPATFFIGEDGIIKSSRMGAFADKNQIEQVLLSSVTEN